KHEKIKEAVVAAHENETSNEKYLCAYFVPAGESSLSAAQLRKYLSGCLPDYMIPTYFVPIDAVPLTSNGKVNIKALPEPVFKPGEDYTAPRDEIETQLVKIWSEVLNISNDISIDDNFFELGGHSLKATRLISKLNQTFHVNVPLAEVFRIPTIKELAEYIKGCKKEIHIPIEPVETKEYYALSSAQERLYILQQMDPAGIGYNIPLAIELKGETDRDRLEKVFRELIEHHESLRTSFHLIENKPVQKIHQEVEFEIEYHSAQRTAQSAELKEERCAPGALRFASTIKDFVRPFDLSRAPLIRAGLVRIKDQNHILMVDMHHIISDGTSMGVLVKNFTALYKGEILPGLKIQYKDYARWQNLQKESQLLKKQKKYWLTKFDTPGEIPVLDLPTDFTRPAAQSFAGGVWPFTIGKKETGKLKEIAVTGETTLYTVLLTLFNVLLAKLAGQEEIIVGSPIAARKHADLEQIIGMFVNTLAQRNYPAGEKTIKEFLQEVKTNTLNAQENQDYPFEDLVEHLAINRDVSRNPLFDVMLTLQNIDIPRFNLPGLTLSIYNSEDFIQTSKFDLSLTAVETGETLLLHFTYCSKLFKQETIARFSRYFKAIVSSIPQQWDTRIANIDILSREEKQQLLVDFNDTTREYTGDKTLHELFAEQVDKTPDHIAVVGPLAIKNRTYMTYSTYISYRELHEKSNHLAHLLIREGVKPETIVGIKIERSIEMIVGILGILKAGGAYLPIDPDYPEERIQYMLTDSSAKIFLTKREITHSFGIWNLEIGISPRQGGQLAYVIYTSGSTGKPKGVMVEHYPVVNLLFSQEKYFNITPDDRVLQFSSICFDASVEQIFISLFSGAVLVLIDKDTLLDNQLFEEFIASQGITHLHAVPSFLNNMRLKNKYKLKRVIAGGDVCPIPLAKRWMKVCDFYNKYGPTETTVTSIEIKVKQVDEALPGLPIGTPIKNTTIYLFDRGMQLVPRGAAGEIYIGGKGVARGYLNRPELTAEKFLFKFYRSYMSSRSYISERIYKTGDLARWLQDGTLAFLGRIDRQIKIRGFRIELEEIENQLLLHHAINEAVVTAKPDKNNDNHLCAYITSGEEILMPELRAHLSKKLPDYMIPSYFVQLEKIPLTSSGKIDRKALPEPGLKINENYIAPKNEIEKKLAGIWQEILGYSLIGIDDNFFHSGGHSLKATILASQIHKAFNVRLPLVEVFKSPTIRGLSNIIKGLAQEKYVSITAVEKKEYYDLSSAQRRLYFLWQMDLESTGYNMPVIMHLEGRLKESRLKDTCKKLIERHESLRTSFILAEGTPVQRVHDEAEFEIKEFSEGTRGLAPLSKELAAVLISSFIRPFDLSRVPLLRVGLIELPHTPAALRSHPRRGTYKSQEEKEGKYLLMVDMHHIISDGISHDILIRNFMGLYKGDELQESPIQYKDFSAWQNRHIEAGHLKEQEEYWQAQFKKDIPLLNLPTDFIRPSLPSFAGDIRNFEIDKKETAGLKKMALAEEATLYMVLLAVFNVFLSKLCGSEDILVGTPVAGRSQPELTQVMGMFVNTLVLRNYPHGKKSFTGFLKTLRESTLNAFENQDYPFERLIENVDVNMNRDVNRNPLFDVMFALQNMEITGFDIPDLKLKPYEYEINIAQFDLSLAGMEKQDGMLFLLEYSTKLFKKETIERFITYFKQTILAVISDPGIEIAEIEIIPGIEKKQVLFDFNNTFTDVPTGKTLSGWFEDQVERTPDHIAVVGPLQVKYRSYMTYMTYISYRELNEKSNRLAYLLIEKGVQADTIVGIMVERSIGMLVSILGILKAGGAYMPIDPQYPQKRVLSMLNDSETFILLAHEKALRNFSYTSIRNFNPVNLEPYVTASRPQVKDFDGLPIPDRSLVNYEGYHQYIGEAPVKHTASIQATRGCPFKCAFCHKIWPKNHVCRSAENLFYEIEKLYRIGIKRIVSVDDIFNLNAENSKRFFKKIIKSGLKVQLFFTNGLRGDILAKELIDLMVEAGTVDFDFSLESASPRIQKLIRKNLNIEKLRENINYIITNHPHVMIELQTIHGFPTETEEEAMMTLDFIKSLQWIDFPYIHMLRIFPGTDMEKIAVQHGISQKAIEESADLAFHQLSDTLPFAKEFTKQYQTKFLNEYFLSKQRFLKVLPKQMKILTEDELVQKYDSYFPRDIKSFADILDTVGISREELKGAELLDEDHMAVLGVNKKIIKHFPVKKPANNALRILLLDVTQYFTGETAMLYDVVNEPLGLMYLLTYLHEKFPHQVCGKIAKSRIDFDNYKELKTLIEDFKPDIIGIRALDFYKDFFHKTVSLIKQWKANVPIIAGGPYATSSYKKILKDTNVDIAVLGEGELTLGEIIEKMLENNKKLPNEAVLKTINGIAFIEESQQQLVKNKQGREILLLGENDEILSTATGTAGETLSNKSHGKYTDLAYVIYTSGSTGRPKGVMVEHGNVVSYLHAFYQEFTINPGDTIIQQTAYTFDAFVEELFSLLLAGGKVAIPSREEILDIDLLTGFIKKNRATIIDCTPLLLNELNREAATGHLRLFISGGDTLKGEYINRLVKKGTVYNTYGPTESAVCAAYYRCEPGIKTNVPIGKPIANYKIYILDKYEKPAPIGIPGELCISGPGLSRGYLNQPELTARKFIKLNLKVNRSHMSYTSHITYLSYITHLSYIYRSGDLARWLPDGNIEFLGRIDHQVKIRGYRIELGEIENRLLSHKDIKEVVVTTGEDINKEKHLYAYVVSAKTFTVSELRDFLARELPGYMIPAQFVQLEKIPLTPGGKVDRKMLLASGEFMETGVEYVSPRSDLEKKLAEIWSEISGRDALHASQRYASQRYASQRNASQRNASLRNASPNIHDNFFDMGGNSFSLIRLNNRIKEVLEIDIPLVTLFNYPTIASLAGYLSQHGVSFTGEDQEGKPGEGKTRAATAEIAVIGMAGRFPGARNTREFWDNLKNGVESVAFLTGEKLEGLGMDADAGNDPNYISAKARLQEIEYFDSFFFAYTPAEAEMMDPQTRIFHECAWEALEDAGYEPGTYPGTIGLYAGASANPYWDILPYLPSGGNSYKEKGVEQWDAVQFSDKDFLSTRVGYKLDLKGPCVIVQTACSTSLVAVDQALQALLSGKCDMALAGGVSVTFQNEAGYIYQQGAIVSPDGHCRAFDARANGTVGGNGAGVVVLKPLTNAINDRDTIYAVIKGSAINNDGKGKPGFSAP
ncbi:MAG: amino acid adenylation domain-containing protein, partial [Candidatus Aminicenantes bacterium]